MVRFLFLAVCLAVAWPSFAQSIPASTVQQDALTGVRCTGTPIHSSLADACQYAFDNHTNTPGYTWTHQAFAPSTCVIYRNASYWQGYSCTTAVPYCADGSVPSYGKCKVKVCPTGYTLNGSMCDPDLPCPMYGTPEGNTAPLDKPASCTCPSEHEWVPMNGCRKKCGRSSYVGNIVGGSATWPGDSFTFPPGSNELCYQGCIIQSAAGEYFQYDDGSQKSKATWTNWACQTSSEPPKPPAQDPPQNPKEPPCGSGEGVLTSSTGKVACVPEGTPAPRKPKVQEKEKVETYPDGSEKKTKETKTTDPKTGASHTHTTTTSTGGMAGPAGTTEGKETDSGKGGDGDGDCEGDDCGDDGYEPGEFPGTEGLYEKKYEDGISGVLNARFDEISNSPLFGLVGKLIPTNVPNSGTCSPFSLSMSIGSKMNYGSGSIAVPCYVWSFIRVVMLISALLLARRLIFGG